MLLLQSIDLKSLDCLNDSSKNNRKFYIVDHQTTVRVLSAEARGIVEKYIDTMLSTISPLVQYFCQEANQKDLQQNSPVEETFEVVRRILEIRSTEIREKIVSI